MCDLMYYVKDENIDRALISLDRVNLEFLFKVLEQLGFRDMYIVFIKILYANVESVLSINGNLSEAIHLRKSVRQGCLLSMMLFNIAQEPLYRMFCYTLRRFSLELPKLVY